MSYYTFKVYSTKEDILSKQFSAQDCIDLNFLLNNKDYLGVDRFCEEKFKNYTPKLNHNETLNVVVIEPRIIEDLITTCKTTLFFLNENNIHIKWGLQIFHGIENFKNF